MRWPTMPSWHDERLSKGCTSLQLTNLQYLPLSEHLLTDFIPSCLMCVVHLTDVYYIASKIDI